MRRGFLDRGRASSGDALAPQGQEPQPQTGTAAARPASPVATVDRQLQETQPPAVPRDPLQFLLSQQSGGTSSGGLPALPRIQLAAAAAADHVHGSNLDPNGDVDQADPAVDDDADPLDALLAGDGDADLRVIVKELFELQQRDVHAQSERKLWEIRIAQTCRKNWRRLGQAIQRSALRLIIRFMKGREERSRANHAKPVKHAEEGLALFESYMGDRNEIRGHRLLWEEVWDWSELYGCWRDKIIIWGVRHHDKREPVIGFTRLPRSLPLGMFQPKQTVFDPNYTLPLDVLAPSAPGSEPTLEGKSVDLSLAESDLPFLKQVRERAEHIAKEVLGGRESDPSLSPAQQKAIRGELDIICANGPLAVCGRSGTGKTACAVARLWARYHAYWSQSQGEPLFPSGHLRIVYITKSALLLDKVRKDVSNLEPRHLLLAPESERDRQEETEQLIGSGDEELKNFASLAEVTDDMYPLFVSRRTWLRLLDGMLARSFFPRQNEEEIDYDIFEASFWLPPKGIRQALSKEDVRQAPHPLLCWTEFLSLLAGSAESLCSPEGYASLEKYQEMGKTRSRMASEKQRELVYKMYERYRKLKSQDKKYRYVITDIAHHIFRGIKDGFRGPRVHEIIVDEVQDFTGAELSLMAMVAVNPSSLFFCGDTVQTVARGLVFRFCDLQSMIRTILPTNRAQFRRLNLSLSYRCHSGTLSCAAVAVDMLQTLFPKELDDDLPRDAGLREGPPPLLLLGKDESSLASFLFADVDGKNSLGADQVVIIRGNSKVREKRIKQLNNLLGASIILTVEEAKGLEFEDVLIFNFFADSPKPDESMWREAVSAAEEEVLRRAHEAAGQPVEERTSKPKRVKPFDPLANRLVAAELKQLYTALTRAKAAVWIFDESDARNPMFYLFKSAEVVQIVEKGEKRGVAWGRDSGKAPEDWRRLGDQLLGQRTYEMAARAYQNAGDEFMAVFTRAEWECHKAESERDGALRQKLYVGAVRLFHECLGTMPSSSSGGSIELISSSRRLTCERAANRLNACAASESNSEIRQQLYRSAAGLYRDAGGGHVEKAADCYDLAGELEAAREVGGLSWSLKRAEKALREQHADPAAYERAATALAGEFDRAARAHQSDHVELERDCNIVRAELLQKAASVGIEKGAPREIVVAWGRASVELWRRIGPSHARLSRTAYSVLIRTMEELGKDDEAEVVLREALEVLPRDEAFRKKHAELQAKNFRNRFLAICRLSMRIPKALQRKHPTLIRS
eukprot:tig00021720_g23177.t1